MSTNGFSSVVHQKTKKITDGTLAISIRSAFLPPIIKIHLSLLKGTQE